MSALDYIIVSVVLIWFGVAVRFLVSAKKNGKSICCGSCSSCSAGCNKYKTDMHHTHTHGKANHEHRCG